MDYWCNQQTIINFIFDIIWFKTKKFAKALTCFVNFSNVYKKLSQVIVSRYIICINLDNALVTLNRFFNFSNFLKYISCFWSGKSKNANRISFLHVQNRAPNTIFKRDFQIFFVNRIFRCRKNLIFHVFFEFEEIWGDPENGVAGSYGFKYFWCRRSLKVKF